jgi:hypothetical protein
MMVDYSRLRSVTARQLASALQTDGFQLHRQKVVTGTTAMRMDAALRSPSTILRIRSAEISKLANQMQLQFF